MNFNLIAINLFSVFSLFLFVYHAINGVLTLDNYFIEMQKKKELIKCATVFAQGF
jgi:hypothetical protein